MGVFITDNIRMPTLNLFARLPETYGPSIMHLFIRIPPGAFVNIDPHTEIEIYDSYSIKLRKLDFQRNGNPS